MEFEDNQNPAEFCILKFPSYKGLHSSILGKTKPGIQFSRIGIALLGTPSKPTVITLL